MASFFGQEQTWSKTKHGSMNSDNANSRSRLGESSTDKNQLGGMKPDNNENDFEEFRPYLRVLAESQLQGKLRAKTEASDIVQQTLLQAYQAREQFRGDSSGEKAAWLRQILANVLTSTARHFQRDKRSVSREQSLAALEQSSLCLGNLLAADNSSPSAGLHREDLGNQIAVRLLALPEDQRSAILMKYWQDCSLAEIGESLDRSSEAVAGLLYRGLKKLRENMPSTNDS